MCTYDRPLIIPLSKPSVDLEFRSRAGWVLPIWPLDCSAQVEPTGGVERVL
jgi:hypothetical protein